MNSYRFTMSKTVILNKKIVWSVLKCLMRGILITQRYLTLFNFLTNIRKVLN